MHLTARISRDSLMDSQAGTPPGTRHQPGTSSAFGMTARQRKWPEVARCHAGHGEPQSPRCPGKSGRGMSRRADRGLCSRSVADALPRPGWRAGLQARQALRPASHRPGPAHSLPGLSGESAQTHPVPAAGGARYEGCWQALSHRPDRSSIRCPAGGPAVWEARSLPKEGLMALPHSDLLRSCAAARRGGLTR
jgi:hypothetical protein